MRKVTIRQPSPDNRSPGGPKEYNNDLREELATVPRQAMTMKRKAQPSLTTCVAATVIWTSASLEAASFPAADPETQGLSRRALESIGDTLQGYSDRDIIVGGTLLVIKNRHCVMSEAYGWKDREAGEPMLPDTLFNIRSMTKMITGAACQILIDEGQVGLDDPVAQYLPGFDTEQSRPITVEQLLTHRSGLPLSILSSVDEYPTLYAMANAIGQHGPQFTPGSRFWYSDAGSDSLGAVVEVVSGMTLDAFVRERLLEPLAMRDTYYLHEAETPRSRIASLYYGRVGAWTNIWTPAYDFYPYAWGSQSLYSTPTDYARFLAMLLDRGIANGRRILSEAAVERILTPVSVMTSLGSTVPHPSGFPNTECYYGQMAVLYQSAVGVEAFGHSGSDGTWAWAWPEHDLMIFYFTQSRGQASGIRLETDFDQWLLHPEVQPSAAAVERYLPYVGWYRASFESALGVYRDEPFAVVIHNDRLGLDVPGQFIFQLTDSSLTGRWYFEIERQLSVIFENDGAGNVTGLRLYEPGYTHRLPRIVMQPATAPQFVGPEWREPSHGDTEPPKFAVRFEGTPHYRYVIETSGNLKDWLPLQTNLLGGSRLDIVDDGVVADETRLYRARVAGP